MNRYSLTHVSDPALIHDLKALLSRERATTAELLAHLAEVDDRRLYAAAGHPSMFAWCVEELHLSEDAAFKRIRAARTARQFPAIRGSLAVGRLYLTAVVFLTPYLTPENADELLAAAAHPARVRPRGPCGPRWPGDGEQPASALSCAQPARGRVRVRSGLHEPQAQRGAARIRDGACTCGRGGPAAGAVITLGNRRL
jgi:hypothetical protein